MSIQTNLKKGFTLIELMVVIVIIGILAAIAIPKLFGMSAKAKAAEVGPAAGTWSKLVSAYILETGETGTEKMNFENLGYTPPGDPDATTPREKSTTKSFEYSSTGTTDDGKTAGWQAKNTVDLNNCKSTTPGTWVATQARSAQTPTPTDPSADCKILTPNFKLLQ